MGGVGFQPRGPCLGGPTWPGRWGPTCHTEIRCYGAGDGHAAEVGSGGGLAELRYADKIFTISHTIHGTFVFVNLHEFGWCLS